ncbi:MAG: serine hydrolase [Acidobacteria bacterium]|nr:MAG: serine hydrolase [Acidobacteriota bacterium]
MKPTRVACLAILLAVLPCLELHAASARGGIDRLMTAYHRCGQFNGVILVKRGDEVIYERAFGLANREWNVANTPDSKFLIGSVSKSYTALMVLILANEGLIDLDATINTYIPRYDGPGKNQATIRQMLTHTSGIPNHGAIPDLSKKRVRWMYDSDQYLELVKETAPKFAPGTGFEYSGIAYNLLAIICEKVTNKSFGELLRQRIFVPLRMSDSTLNSNLDVDARRAYGYEYYLLDGYKLPSYISMDHCKGSGGILSTVGDMAKFNHECFDAQTLTSKPLYKAMLTPHVKDWQYYGYGWWIDTVDVNGDKKTLISHGGSTDGYKAYSTRVVEDRTDIIILENDYFRTDVGVKWCYDLTNDIIDILAGKEVPEPKKSIAKELGLTIGREGIDKALAQLAVLKKDPAYQVGARDYYVLASELDSKNGLKAESIRIFEAGLADHPDDFRLNYYLAERLAGTDDTRALELYKKCIQLYDDNEANARFSEEYKKAVTAVNGPRSGAIQ